MVICRYVGKHCAPEYTGVSHLDTLVWKQANASGFACADSIDPELYPQTKLFGPYSYWTLTCTLAKMAAKSQQNKTVSPIFYRASLTCQGI